MLCLFSQDPTVYFAQLRAKVYNVLYLILSNISCSIIDLTPYTQYFNPFAHKLKKIQITVKYRTDRILKWKSMEIWFHITGQNNLFSLVLLVIQMLWSYMTKKLLPFVNLSTVYEKKKWVPVSINWSNSASSLLATTAFINFQLTDGLLINISIKLDMFKPEIPSSKFLYESHDQRKLNPNTKLELHFLWNPNTLLTNPFHIHEQ